MKTTSQAMTTAVGIAVLATLFVSHANAQCGVPLGWPASFDSQNAQFAPLRMAPQSTQPTASSDRNTGGPSIVGMWDIKFVSQGNATHNPPIPDGAVIDFGYSQWHSDGTEFLNSGGRPPATQNFCLGVWQKIGYDTYMLNHLALSYDSSGTLNGRANIREDITLDWSGNTCAGTFTIDLYDTRGAHVDRLMGQITGTRVTVDTTTQ